MKRPQLLRDVRWFGVLIALVLPFNRFPLLAASPDEQPAQLVQSTAPLAQVTLTPAKDNTIYEESTAVKSNGVGVNLFVGNTRNGDARRALLAFDLAGQIPAGSTILTVTLQMQMSQTRAGIVPIQLHKLNADWGEGASNGGDPGGNGAPAQTGDATWLHARFDTAQWTTAGGDFVTTTSATTPVGAVGSYTWRSAQMVADVQGWVENPGTNFGWMLIGDETNIQTAKRFGARENSTAASRPQLTIVYESSTLPQQSLFLPVVIN